jgi:predicted nucleic acid-binding protein
MAAQKRRILVDSDAWVALAKQNDAHHGEAQKILTFLEEHPVQLFTTNYVFTESVTVISQRVSHAAALQYIAAIKRPLASLKVLWVTEDLEEPALELFRSMTSKNVSLVDCANMAAMDYWKLDAIFSFDHVYSQHGYADISVE